MYAGGHGDTSQGVAVSYCVSELYGDKTCLWAGGEEQIWHIVHDRPRISGSASRPGLPSATTRPPAWRIALSPEPTAAPCPPASTPTSPISAPDLSRSPTGRSRTRPRKRKKPSSPTQQ